MVSVPTLANMIPAGKTPILPDSELESMSFAAVVWPNVFTDSYATTGDEPRFGAASHRHTRPAFTTG
jgi:2-methylisocitrate lyase-like PEP mutase family enzyme